MPEVDVDDFSLKIDGLGVRETELTLNELKSKFPKVSVTAAIQCAGNRRSEMSKVNPKYFSYTICGEKFIFDPIF